MREIKLFICTQITQVVQFSNYKIIFKLGIFTFYLSFLLVEVVEAIMAQITDLQSVLKERLREDRAKIVEPLQEANEVLKDAAFKTFESDSICTKQTELSMESFSTIVDDIVKSYGFAEKCRVQLKSLCVDEDEGKDEAKKIKFLKIHRATADGNVVYGIFAISVNQGKTIDMIYAVYTAKYEFEPSRKIQKSPKKFVGVTWDRTETSEYQYPHIPDNFMRAFFENKAIEALQLEC